jgi:quercetin dioxygenase-like cupin family protein
MTTKVLFIAAVLLLSLTAMSQVQVSKEPRHVPVIENEYIRLLDVRLPPGDTTFYHIHSTPSLFIILTDTWTASQTQGEQWSRSKSATGQIWYRSFQPDSLIHRVANIDSTIFHVNDIEILSSFRPAQHKLLPFPVILNNDKACAYGLDNAAMQKKITDHGPLIAEMVAGSPVTFHGLKTTQTLKAGQHLYIAPGTAFYFSATGKNAVKIILFEIK